MATKFFQKFLHLVLFYDTHFWLTTTKAFLKKAYGANSVHILTIEREGGGGAWSKKSDFVQNISKKAQKRPFGASAVHESKTRHLFILFQVTVVDYLIDDKCLEAVATISQ